MVFSGNVRRIATVITANDQATGKLAAASAAGDQTAQSFRGTASSAISMKGAFMASAAATAVLTATLGALVKRHGETEATFARMAEVSGATNEQMGMITDTAKELGAQLPISMQDAAGAMEQLAFAGFSAEESMQAAAGVANVAVASSMNMKEAATSTGTALRAFGLEADQTAAVTGTMAQTFSSSAANIRMIDSALRRLAPAASQVGVTIQESAAAIGVLADNGMRGARSATMLRRAFTKLLEQSNEEHLNSIGVSLSDITDEEGNLRDLDMVMQQLSEGFSTLENNTERARLAHEMFGSRGKRAVLPLLDSVDELGEKMRSNFQAEVEEALGQLNQMDPERLEEMGEALEMDGAIDPSEFGAQDLAQQLTQLRDEGMESQEMMTLLMNQFSLTEGAAERVTTSVQDQEVSYQEIGDAISEATTAQEIAAAQMDTTQGAITFLKSSIDTMAFAIFEGAAPAVEWLNEKLAVGINILNNNTKAMKAVGAVLVALTVAAAGLTAIIGGSLLASMISVSAIAATVGGALASIAAAIPPVLVAVGVLVSAFVALREFWESDIMGLQSNIQQLVGMFQNAADAIMPAINALIPVLVDVGKILMGIVGGAIAAQVAVFAELVVGIAEGVSWLIQMIDTLGSMVGLWDALGTAFGMAADLLATVSTAAEPVIGVLEDVWNAIQPVVSILGKIIGVVGTVIGVFLAVSAALGPVIAAASTVAAVLGTVASVVAFLINPVTLAIGVIIGLYLAFQKVMDFLDGVPIGEIVGRIVDSIIETFRELPSKIVTLAKDTMIAFGDAIINATDLVADALSGVPIIGGIVGLQNQAINAMVGLGQDVVSAFADGIMAYINLVKEQVGNIVDLVSSLLSGDFSGAADAAKAIIDAFVGGLMAGVSAVRDAIFGVVDAIASFLPFSNASRGPLSNVMGVGSALIDGIAGGLKAGIGAVKTAISGVADAIGNVLGGLGDMASNAASAVTDGLKSGLKSGVDAVSGAVDSVGSAVTGVVDAGGSMVSAASRGASAVTSTVSDGLESGTDAVSDAAGYVGDAIGGALPGSDAGESVVGTVSKGIEKAKDEVPKQVKSVAEQARSFLPFSDAETGPLADLTDSGSALVKTLTSGIEGEQEAVAQAMSSVLPEGVPQGMVPGVDEQPPVEASAGASESEGQPTEADIDVSMEMNVDVGDIEDTDDLQQELESMAEDVSAEVLKDLERRITQDLGLNIGE